MYSYSRWHITYSSHWPFIQAWFPPYTCVHVLFGRFQVQHLTRSQSIRVRILSLDVRIVDMTFPSCTRAASSNEVMLDIDGSGSLAAERVGGQLDASLVVLHVGDIVVLP